MGFLPDRLEPEAEVGALDEDEDDRDARRGPGTTAMGAKRDCSFTVGSQSARSKGTVPDIEATPGLFQGPKMSQRLSGRRHVVEAEAAEDLVDAAEGLEGADEHGPEGAAGHARQDGEGDREARGRSPPRGRGPGRSAGPRSRRSAPKVIWPSMPMFHRPTVKVTRRPEVTRSSGTQATRTSEATLQLPTAPRAMLA